MEKESISQISVTISVLSTPRYGSAHWFLVTITGMGTAIKAKGTSFISTPTFDHNTHSNRGDDSKAGGRPSGSEGVSVRGKVSVGDISKVSPDGTHIVRFTKRSHSVGTGMIEGPLLPRVEPPIASSISTVNRPSIVSPVSGDSLRVLVREVSLMRIYLAGELLVT